MALARQVGGDAREADAALHDYIAKNGKTQPYYVAELYALRQQPDLMFEWLDRARQAGAARVATILLSDPLVLRYKDDPRFAALTRDFPQAQRDGLRALLNLYGDVAVLDHFGAATAR